jgi:hypothetical protein
LGAGEPEGELALDALDHAGAEGSEEQGDFHREADFALVKLDGAGEGDAAHVDGDAGLVVFEPLGARAVAGEALGVGVEGGDGRLFGEVFADGLCDAVLHPAFLASRVEKGKVAGLRSWCEAH